MQYKTIIKNKIKDNAKYFVDKLNLDWYEKLQMKERGFIVRDGFLNTDIYISRLDGVYWCYEIHKTIRDKQDWDFLNSIEGL